MAIVERHGPYGSSCQPNWCLQLNRCERIVEVIISCGFIVDGIGFVISDPCGNRYTKWFGGRGGNGCTTRLRCNEYITKISGTYGNYSYCCYRVIASLKIHTNCCPSGYGPFGQGRSCNNVCGFSTSAQPCGSIVGFFGKSGQYLESIGTCVRRG
ncbi:mannose/glucose-specific lectin [Beta vulgaris subsp. vulgaris]|uniref:mannose/glucose-specific lectin n=1 Tax=Beta vulgaris subsp. vulgaris TaxID=3555 RepID=UPI00053FCE56|nr:mannose/glucose-specific lectin [Beta vulgaris subsp. vulgaris]